MLKSIHTKNVFKMTSSFLLGSMIVFTFAFQEKEIQLDSKSHNSVIFGDAKITVVDINVPDKPDISEFLCIRKGDYPFIGLYKDSFGKIVSFTIFDGNNGLALSKFNDSRISRFTIFGNKVHDNSRLPVFTFQASDKPGVWRTIMYLPTVKEIYENGKHITYAQSGEQYNDIDFDGQFDAKSLYNEDFNIISQSIYVEGNWKELGRRDPQGNFHQTGSYIVEQSYAFNVENGKNIEYDFVFGKGWKRRTAK